MVEPMPTESLISLGAVATTIAAIGGLIISLFKIGPEKSKIVADAKVKTASAEKSAIEAMERVVATSTALLDPYEEQVEHLRKSLVESNEQTLALNTRLREANNRATDLEDKLNHATRQLEHYQKQVVDLQSQLEEAHRIISAQKG